MIKYLIICLLFLTSKLFANSEVIYGGFSYGSILPKNTLTKYAHDRSNGQSLIDKLLINNIKKLDNKSFKISFDTLSDGLSEKDQNVLVFSLDNETINFITIQGDNLTRTDIILNFQIIFFNAKNNSLTASIPLEVSKVLNSSEPLSEKQLIQELKKMYENEIMQNFFNLANNFNLKNKYNSRIGITKIILEENAKNFRNL